MEDIHSQYPLTEEASTKSPPPWMSALSTGLDRQKEGSQPPVKCYSLRKQINHSKSIGFTQEQNLKLFTSNSVSQTPLGK